MVTQNSAAAAPASHEKQPNSEPTAAELHQWDRERVWHGFTQMAEYVPLIITTAHGCTLVDLDGRELLDGVGSLWCNVHGHRHPRLDQALKNQIDQVAHVTSLGMSSATTIRFAHALTEAMPGTLKHVFFSDNGSTAVEVAVKMALQYWQQRYDPRPRKSQYAALDLAYHGDTLGGVSLGGIARFHQVFDPLLFHPIRLPAPDCYRLPVGVTQQTACVHYLDEIEAILASHQDELAAVVMEPLVQGAGGILTHPPGFLRGMRELTHRYDILLIADEVAVGMGRTGTMLACQQEQVVPDLICLAKGLSAGYLPMAATIATTEIWESFRGTFAESRTFFHGHTFGGNPLAAAVGLESLRIFAEERTLERMCPAITALEQGLDALRRHPLVGDVRSCGLMAGVELVVDQATQQPPPWEDRWGQRVCDHALARGVWLRPLGNVVVIMPPLCVSANDVRRICDAVDHGVQMLQRELES